MPIEKDVLALLSEGASYDHPTIVRFLGAAEKMLDKKLAGAAASVASFQRRRFLVACKLNVELAANMIRANCRWRQAHIPVVETTEVLAELAKGKLELPGDRDLLFHQPIIIVRSRNYDPNVRNLLSSMKATVLLLEKALAQPGATQVCVYYDRTGFEFQKNWDLEYLQAVINTLSTNYPETLSRVYVHPAGPALEALWPMVAHLLDPRTASKVEMPSMSELTRAIPSHLI